MTVYSNIITIHGADAAHVIFRAVHGWLKGQLGHHIEYRDIFRTETLEGKKRSGASVRSKTYLATRSEPKLYAWRLRHRDALISTRSWVVEIGVREDDGHATATVVVTVEDENTLVDVTVRPSRPKFVQYLVDAIHKQRDLWFSPETPPRDVMWIDCDDHELIALHEEIHRSTRAYPIVLVSPAPNGEFLINIERLSRELVGLAEIVAIGENCNTYRLEEVLKRRFSAFGGAINVIAPTLQHDQIVRTRLLLSDQLLDLAEADREQFILANVTAFTNRLYRRRLITADKVGLKYESMDIADDLGADHVGSVTEMPFADESFDVVGCFEVLEHIEFALFRKALSELCRVAKDAVILSVPDALSVWPYSFWIPKVGPKRVLLRRPFTRKREHVFDGEHYWEINKGGYEFDDVVAEVAEQAEESGYQLCRTYRVWENPYHRFFVLRRHSPSL